MLLRPVYYRHYRYSNKKIKLETVRLVFVIFKVFFFTMEMCQESLSGAKRMIEGMGVKSWMNWICWFIHCTVPQIIENFIIIIIFKCDVLSKDSALLNNSNGLIVFLNLLLYGFTITATCAFFTVCFSSVVSKWCLFDNFDFENFLWEICHFLFR